MNPFNQSTNFNNNNMINRNNLLQDQLKQANSFTNNFPNGPNIQNNFNFQNHPINSLNYQNHNQGNINRNSGNNNKNIQQKGYNLKSNNLLSSNFLHLLNKNYNDSKLSSMAYIKIINSKHRNSIVPAIPEIFTKNKEK